MKYILLLSIPFFLLIGCEADKIGPDRYVMPVTFISSRIPEGIQLQWLPFLSAFYNSQTSGMKLFAPGGVKGEGYTLYHSTGDSLHFERIHEYEKESNSFLFIPDEMAMDHFFKLKGTAPNARPFISRIIQVQNRTNAPVELLVELPYDYVMQLGNFSPDGKQILYSRNYKWKNEGNCCEDYSILSFHPGTNSESLILPETFEPYWSPGGDRITFRSSFGIIGAPAPGNIGIYEIQQDSVIQLTNGPNNFQRPLWFPDGNEIIFLSDLPGQIMDYWEVMRYDLSTGEWGPLFVNTSVKAINRPFSFSPDGKKLAFTDIKEDYWFKIQYVDLENQITGTEVASNWSDQNPSYSPDGKYLAFLSDRSGKNEIWLKELENEGYQQLTGNEDYQLESELTWSHDSKRIYYKSYLDNIFGIYYLEL